MSSARGSADLLDEVADFAAIIGYGVGDWQGTPLRDWSRIDDLCQDFGHGSSRIYAAMGSSPAVGLVRSKKASIAWAGIW